MARTFWGQGPDEGDESARRPAGPTETGAKEPSKEPLASSDAAVAGPDKGAPGAPTASPRPTRTTPGGSGLAAILIQNRTKTGKQKILEGEGAIPERTRSPTGSFELLEVTAVGGAPVSGAKSDSGADPNAPAVETGPGALAGRTAATFPARTSHPTPGGGLPGLLMRTQLGLGDSVRVVIEGNERKQPPVTLAPLRPTPTGAAGLDRVDDDAAAASPEDDGQKTDAVPFAGSMEAPSGAPSAAAESASVPIVDAGSGAVTGAVVQATEAQSGLGDQTSSGVVALPSGPVFELATGQVGQVGEGSGASGPVFDLISGPITGVGGSSPSGPPAAAAVGESSGPAETLPPSGASRPAHPTPTNGRLAALLAESRKRSGRHEIKHEVQHQGVEKTETGPTAAGSGSSVASAGTEAGANDVATVRVPGASMAEKRGPGFAATLLGLPGPEQQAIEAALASVRGAAATTMPGVGRSVSARDGDKREQNTPLPVEGEATERSLLSSGDVRRGWQRTSGEEKRITEIVDVVPSARQARVKAAVVIAGGVLAIGGVIFLGSLRKPKHGPSAPVPALGARLAAPAPEETPPPVRGLQAEEPTRAAGEPEHTLAGGSAVATPPTPETAPAAVAAPPAAEKRNGNDEPAPAAAAAEAQHAPVDVDSASGSAVTPGGGDHKRTAAHSETHRSDTDRAELKTRRRASEGRGARAGGSATGASGDTNEPVRTRMAQPSRTPEADPDATLPLGIR